MFRRFDLVLILLCATLMVAAFAVPVRCAEQTPEAKAIANTPTKVTPGVVSPVAVIHENVDETGARLALGLKETFNKSSLFTLTAKDEKKLKLVLTTSPEFPGREHIGSVYGVVWIFSSSENVLAHYLDSASGTVDAATADAVAQTLAARTTAIAEKYAYLFE